MLKLLIVDFRSLSLRLLLVDLHLAVLVVYLHIVGHCDFAEVGQHGLAVRGQLQFEVGLQLAQIDIVIVRLLIGLLELEFDLLLDHRAGLLQLLLLFVLLTKHIGSLQHENHLLLRLLQQGGELDADLLGQLFELRVLLLNQLDQLTDLLLEVVETLAHEDSLLELSQYLVYGRLR